MVETIGLLLKLLDYLEKNGKDCICDVLDRMYLSGYIRFEDIDKLHQYISEHIPDAVVDSAILSENPEIFTYHLRKEIKVLQSILSRFVSPYGFRQYSISLCTFNRKKTLIQKLSGCS